MSPRCRRGGVLALYWLPQPQMWFQTAGGAWVSGQHALLSTVAGESWVWGFQKNVLRQARLPPLPAVRRDGGRLSWSSPQASFLGSCVLVSRKWPQLESADWVSVAGRQRASCPGIHLGQKAAGINIELQLVEAVPLKPTHSPVGNTQWKIWIQVGKRASWQQLTCHCTEERSETLPPHQLW